MNRALREQTLERLKDGRLDILIATDVAARGTDVERISGGELRHPNGF